MDMGRKLFGSLKSCWFWAEESLSLFYIYIYFIF